MRYTSIEDFLVRMNWEKNTLSNIEKNYKRTLLLPHYSTMYALNWLKNASNTL